MVSITGRRQFGLYTNGQCQLGDNTNFTGYSYTTDDAMSGDGCLLMGGTNIYGNGVQGNEYVAVDPSKYAYVASVSVKTKTTNYAGNNGSGHLGFACYDINKNFIGHNQAYSQLNTTLTRAASPGDTRIYIGRGDWYDDGTSHRRSMSFYWPGSPYPTVGGYSRYNMYAKIVQNSIVATGSGDYQVDFTTGLPDWGHTYAIGTACGSNQAGGSYNYAHGAPIYPTTWTTYTTPVMQGYVMGAAASGADFRDGTRFIKFLNLRNYNYRSNTAGVSATYYLDNITLYRVKPPSPVQVADGATYRSEFSDSTVRSKIGKVSRFKFKRRGGQKRSDFF